MRYRMRIVLRPLISYIYRSWAIRGGPTSGLAAPAKIQLPETVHSTKSLPGDPETSHKEAGTIKVPRVKMAVDSASFTSTGNDSAV